MELETKIQRAINVIEKRPGIRTDELARAIGVEPAKVAPLIFSATRNGFITSCKVERPGKSATNEYRLASSVVASDWDNYRSSHTESLLLTKKAQPYRRDTTQQRVENPTAVSPENQAAKAQATVDDLNNKIEGMSEQIADLQVALDLAQQTICSMKLEAEQANQQAAAPSAIAYLVRVPKRDPRLFTRRERAIEAAVTAAKTAGHADVLALVPVGTARRKVAASINWSEN